MPVVKTKYHSFDEYASAINSNGFIEPGTSQLLTMYQKTLEIPQPVILELGTARGESATVFLQACEQNDGKLVSVDIKDCSDISDSNRWQFVQSDSTNVDFIVSKAPYLNNGIDVLYIDSLHKRAHVAKELMGWYPLMKGPSWIFFDDVDAHPYRKGQRKDNFKLEVVRDEICEFIKDFYYANEASLELSIHYGSTGLACLHKLCPMGTVPGMPKDVDHRSKNIWHMARYSPKALVRVLLKRADE